MATRLCVTFVSFALTSCGGGGDSTPPLPLLEALIIDPNQIDWASVLAASRVSPAAAGAIDAALDEMYATVRELGGDPAAFDHSGWETSQCPTLEIVDPM